MFFGHLVPAAYPTRTRTSTRSVVRRDTATEHVVLCAAAGVLGHAGQADSDARQGELVQGLLHAHTM